VLVAEPAKRFVEDALRLIINTAKVILVLDYIEFGLL
jgi:hypothetical protein